MRHWRASCAASLLVAVAGGCSTLGPQRHKGWAHGVQRSDHQHRQ